MEPKVNEVWMSYGGNFCIIALHAESMKLGFLWFDREDNTLCFTELRNQLAEKRNMSVFEALARMLG